MARNGSGTYAVPNSFSSGTTIASADVNTNFTDVGAEITNSLPRDGQAAMTGQLKAANGTAAAPGVTFGSDTDTGFFRKTTNTMGIAAGGVEIGTIDGTGIADANGNYISAIPAGTLMLFVQTTAPTGWSKNTTHNDKALRVVSGTVSSGGTTPFSSVFAARTIAQANLPAATLSVTGTTSSDGSHEHGVGANSASDTATTGAGTRLTSLLSGGTSQNTAAAGTHTHTVTGTTSALGSGTAIDFAVQYVDVIICGKDG